MHKKCCTILWNICLLFVLYISVQAAPSGLTADDIYGQWECEEETKNGTIEYSLRFLQENDRNVYVYVEYEDDTHFDRQEGLFEVVDHTIRFLTYTPEAVSIADVSINEQNGSMILTDANEHEYILEGQEADAANTSAETEQEETQAEKDDASAKVLTYTGSGDDIVMLDDFDDWFMFVIDGNASSGYFGVIAYDERGERIEALVNTTEVYHGIVYDDTQSAKMLEVKADGPWSIRLVSLYAADYALKGDTVTGTGDDVVVFYTNNGTSMTAKITGNRGSDYFGVIAYDGSGSRVGALVNTTDVYSGTVMLKGEPRIFKIKAEGDWSITFE